MSPNYFPLHFKIYCRLVEEEERDTEIKKIHKRITAEKSPYLLIDINLEIQEAEQPKQDYIHRIL